MTKRYGIQIQAKSDTDSLNGTMVKLNEGGDTFIQDEQWVRKAAERQNLKYGGGFYHFEVIEQPEVA